MIKVPSDLLRYLVLKVCPVSKEQLAHLDLLDLLATQELRERSDPRVLAARTALRVILALRETRASKEFLPLALLVCKDLLGLRAKLEHPEREFRALLDSKVCLDILEMMESLAFVDLQAQLVLLVLQERRDLRVFPECVPHRLSPTSHIFNQPLSVNKTKFCHLLNTLLRIAGAM